MELLKLGWLQLDGARDLDTGTRSRYRLEMKKIDLDIQRSRLQLQRQPTQNNKIKIMKRTPYICKYVIRIPFGVCQRTAKHVLDLFKLLFQQQGPCRGLGSFFFFFFFFLSKKVCIQITLAPLYNEKKKP